MLATYNRALLHAALACDPTDACNRLASTFLRVGSLARHAFDQMVHGMDAMSAKWRDDPVRAALEKKKNREAAADRMAKANEMAGELLKKRLAAQGASSSGGGRLEDAEDVDHTSMSNSDYRKVGTLISRFFLLQPKKILSVLLTRAFLCCQMLDRERQRRLDGDDSDSSSSNLSVFDPFMSKCARPFAAPYSRANATLARCLPALRIRSSLSYAEPSLLCLHACGRM